MKWEITPAKKGLRGEITVPPDKSISHRAVMFGSIARGKCEITNFLMGEDCLSTLNAFRAMGVNLEVTGGTVKVTGTGLRGLRAPEGQLYLGNSGTTMRILSGILAGQSFGVTLTGDASLSRRPMRRVVAPLSLMGASVKAENDPYPPLIISPAEKGLKGIGYTTPVASAQVKSCVLSAGLYAGGETSVTEPFQSRDHTERMLKSFSADISTEGLTTVIKGGKELEPPQISVPGDISSAAFFMVGALLTEKSDIVLRNVGLNPTRDGLLRVLKRMGADIEVLDLRQGSEPAGDIRVRYSELRSTRVTPEEIPLLIDEIPVLMIAALTATGITEIQSTGELKVKETDRVSTMKSNLSRLGVKGVSETKDSLFIEGGLRRFHASGDLAGYGDHRIAMSMAIASLIANNNCRISDVSCVETSYPGFLMDLERLKN